MQSNSAKLYFCHSCKKTVVVQFPNLICPDCSSDFLQEANMGEIEPVVPREVSFMEIVSIFSETRDPAIRRTRILERILQDNHEEGRESRPFRVVLRELLERSGRTVPASDETIQNITTVKVEWKEDDECKICADYFVAGDEKKILACEHQFHSDCLVPWLKQKNTCPVCRQTIQS